MPPAPLHVLLIVTKGEVGGAQTHLIELCRALQGQVRFSVVIGGTPDTPLERSLKALGIRTLALPQLRNTLNPMHVLRAVSALLKLVRQDPPHLLHAHSAVAGVVARLAGKLHNTPVVYTVHGFGFKPQAPRMTRLSAWLAEAVLAAWTTRMVCVSQHEQTLARQLPMDPARVSTIPNAIADTEWRSQPERDRASIVMVARMAAPKRHDLLLQSLAPLARLGLQPATHLLGSGPLRPMLVQMAEQLQLPHVHFAGDVHNVAEQLAGHQIFVLLSDHEGLPISLIEAMRAGMAIVASRLPGVQELLTHDDSALLVDNTTADIGAALQRLMHDAPLRQRLGQAARQRYETRYRPEVMAAQVLQVYEEAPLLPTSTWPMTLPRRHRATLASQRAREQHTHLLWTLLGLLPLGMVWVLGSWWQAQQWVTTDFHKTVLVSLLPYAVASHLIYRGTHLPAAERSMLLFVTTAVPFVLTPLLFGLQHMGYARSALLLCYLVTTLWFWLGYRWLIAPRALRLACWHDEQAQHLHKLLAELGPEVEHAAAQRLQLVHWPQHWREQPERCPANLSVQGALAEPPAGGLADASHRNTLTTLKLHHIRLYSAQAIAEALAGRVPRSVLESELWQPDGNPAYDLIKRLLDVSAIVLTLPLWLPLAVVAAVMVRVDSPGPILFGQWRTGQHGQPFRLYKFRSMRHEAHDSPRFAQQADTRITRWGAIMRRSRIDEIPQLWNVLRGHMSLIGPRPEQHAFVQQFAKDIPSYPYRHLVRPGLTGWAQVQQGYAASTDETAIKLSYDLYYVTHYSLAMDLLILSKTIRTLLTGQGAR